MKETVKYKRLVAAVAAVVAIVMMVVVSQTGQAKDGVQSSKSIEPPVSVGEPRAEATAGSVASPTYGATANEPEAAVSPVVSSPTYGWTPGDYSWIELERYLLMNGEEAYDFGPDLYDKSKTAEDYDKELRRMIEGEEDHHDVILGVSAKYYLDTVLGRNKRAEAKKFRNVGQVEQEVNDLITKYVRSNSRAYEVKIADEAFLDLDAAKSVKVEKRKISDMFYQNHYKMLPELDVDVPSVMIMKPIQDTVWALVYTFEKDGIEREAVFSISKSFAPADITKYINVEPGEWEYVLDK